jgi:hypothetical protein
LKGPAILAGLVVSGTLGVLASRYIAGKFNEGSALDGLIAGTQQHIVRDGTSKPHTMVDLNTCLYFVTLLTVFAEA